MSLRTVCAALCALAALLLIVVQFTTWATAHFEGGSTFGFDFPDSDFEARTWEAEASSGGSSEDHSWYDSENDGKDGVGQIRTAIPFLLVGLVAAAAAAAASFGSRGAAGPIIALVAGLVTAVATILFATGIDAFLDGMDFDWSVAFYLAIASGVLLLAGGVAGLVGANRSPGA